jgi:3-oxoacyl-[acyl-carrier protein] reductase
VKKDGLAAVAEATRGAPGKVHTRKLDVSSEADVGAFVDCAAEAMGGLNGLINNAGILRDGLLVKKDRTTGQVTKLTREQWDAVIGVNLTGATLMVRDAVAKDGRDRPAPSVIVNMSSIARHGNRGQSNYVSAKAALAANTRT